MYGPNTNLGGNSIIVMIESQMRYLAEALEHLRHHRLLAVKPKAAQSFNQQLQEPPVAHGVGRRLQ